MAEIIDSLNMNFVGTVKGYRNNSNKNDKIITDEKELDNPSRDLEVYIPKLMPGIDERNSHKREVLTNCGNPNIQVQHNKNIVLGNTIKLQSFDTQASLPKIGSNVLCIFLDQHWDFRYWYKFNPNGNWETIEKEKYPEVFSIYLNDKNNVSIGSTVNKNDKIKFSFSDFKIYKKENTLEDGTKEIEYYLKQDTSTELNNSLEKISALEKRIRALETELNNIKTYLNEEASSSEESNP